MDTGSDIPRPDRSPRRGEDGFAVPTVLFLLLAAMAVVTVGLMATIRSQSGVTRDAETKTAFAAAEAGVSEAMLRYSRIPTSACLVAGNGGSVVAAATLSSPAGWCTPVTGRVGDASYSYQVKPGNPMEVVSTGTIDGVTRRIKAEATPDAIKPFANASIISKDDMHMNSNALVNANVATGGNLSMDSNAKMCGNVQVGIGKNLTKNGNAQHLGLDCTGTGALTQGALNLPPVDQGDVATNNSNGRLCQFSNNACPVVGAQDTYTGSRSNVMWNPTSRTLSLNSNTTVTLAGGNYSLCQLLISSNSTIYVAAGVRFWFDSPEACGRGGAQVTLNSNSYINPLSSPADVAMFFVGSDTISTSITLNSNTQLLQNCVGGIIVYAPRTDVQLNSDSSYCGAMAAKSIRVDSRAKVYADDLADDWSMGGADGFTMTEFTECNTAAATIPNSNC